MFDMNGRVDNLRRRLDAVDNRIVGQLAERFEIIDELAGVKRGANVPVRDPERERTLLTRVTGVAAAHGLPASVVRDVFRSLLDHSVERQQHGAALRVAYQGVPGAFSHLAAQRLFERTGIAATFTGFPSFRAAVQAVTDGRADRAVLPVENSTAGSVYEVCDLLLEFDLRIIAEEVHRIEHCLLGVTEIPVERLTRIRSHPQALAQCSRFLHGLAGCHVEAVADTAGAARQVQADANPEEGAIASEAAAAEYGLVVLQRGIANQEQNCTRFLVVTARAHAPTPEEPNKVSVVFSVEHTQGRLAQCLNELADRGLNLTRIASRPRPESPWEYQFYVDFHGDPASSEVRSALEALEGHTTSLTVLGTYRAAETTRCPTRSAAVAPVESTGPYRLASRAGRTDTTHVAIGGVSVGGAPVVIAGPCSVETREQLFACADAVRRAGGHILRGGCFKPRTSPYAFQGLGVEGLRLLREAGDAFGLPVVTEVLAPDQVPAVAEMADAIQIGARNMQNFELLRAVGRTDRPVVLKRGLMASIDEWLAAAEYILHEGNDHVVLCERGIRTFETATRNTLDLSAVQVVRERSHLPVIVDPSHACGVARWIPPMAAAALAAGAHGLMVEIHPDPGRALSDGEQSLTLDAFQAMMHNLPLSQDGVLTMARRALA